MTGELKQEVLTMLAGHNTMTIATINQLGKPEAAAVFYVNHGFQLVFFSNPDSRHAQNIGNGCACAATIQMDYKNWREIKGLQLEGKVIPLASAMDKTLAMKLYLNKYGFLNDVLVEGHKIFQALHKSKIYKFTPEIIWVTDNNYAFGKRRKLTLSWSSTDPVCENE
ncbi:MAG: pyridoxamine 5'-phosphate oxidase family protein [Clostridia bacterium]|nr:pyridoxamine 5'-phosphate oxidase family protein [Clostridia bacterium]